MKCQERHEQKTFPKEFDKGICFYFLSSVFGIDLAIKETVQLNQINNQMFYKSSSVTGVRRHMCSAPLIGNLK